MASFRDRFFTSKVARAMMSPLAILALGTGASAGILAGAPSGGPEAVIGGILGALLGWGIRVGLAIPGGPKASQIDPFTVSEPWRRLTQDALGARSQFTEAVRRTRGGAIQDRLSSIGGRIDDSIDEVWAAAVAGHELTDAYSRVDAITARRELDTLLARYPEGSRTPTVTATISSLEAQLGTAQRMYDLIVAAKSKLELLNARLDETVARSIELSVGSHSVDEYQQVEGDMVDIVTELGALREAIDETSTVSAPSPTLSAVPQSEPPQPRPSTG